MAKSRPLPAAAPLEQKHLGSQSRCETEANQIQAATSQRTQSCSALRRWITHLLVPLYLLLIGGLPLTFAAVAILAAPTNGSRFIAVALAPAVATIIFVLTCGLLSLPVRRATIAGRFPRDLGHPVYGPRRLYALCWTALYYCPPVYHVVLALAPLKRLVFRLFGYRGSLQISLYPDTWIRDLPLLQIGEGAYLSNKATIGTNMCLMNGDIIVRPVRIEGGALIGHLAMLGPGSKIRRGAEIGVGSAIGLNTEIGERTHIAACCVVSHSARIGADVVIGTRCFVGARVRIADGIRIPSGAIIPDGVKLRTQSEVQAYSSSRQDLFTDAGHSDCQC